MLSVAIIPTYNERENLARLVPAVLDTDAALDVLVVFNTDALGLILRSKLDSTARPIKTLQDGTALAVVGQDSTSAGQVWKHVRDPQGAEGWVAADYVRSRP